MKRPQNTTHAVMAQRREPHDSLDDFPTPPWATRALIKHVILPHVIHHPMDLRRLPVWQPDCNRGYMARPLMEYHDDVFCTDIHNYGWSGQHAVQDFLWPDPEVERRTRVLYSNPPFRLAEQFIQRALALNLRFAAFIVRTAFLEGVKRYRSVYSKTPPTFVCPFVERVPMVKGRHDPKINSATSYTWLVWSEYVLNDGLPKVVWIPPCRKQLEREDDINVD